MGEMCTPRGVYNALGDLVPNAGTRFRRGEHQYRVDAWLKASTPRPSVADVLARRDLDMQQVLTAILDDSQQAVGPDDVRVEFCPQEEATYVSGSGICGCIERVSDLVITGVVNWTPERLAEAQAQAERLGELREKVW